MKGQNLIASSVSRSRGRRRYSLALFLSIAAVLLLLPVPLHAADSCAEKGKQSKQCGATGGRKAKKCCGGLTCYEDKRNFKCVTPKEAKSAPDKNLVDKNGVKGRVDKCAAYGENAWECGTLDKLDRPASCCKGYKCKGNGSLSCINAIKELAPLDEIGPRFQKKPITVNKKITVVGTTFDSAFDSGAVKICVPFETEKGNLLLMLVGGSASGNKIPTLPNGWNLIVRWGKKDLNLAALYKWYGGNSDADCFNIPDGKNTFVILTAIDGVDRRHPIVDILADRNSAPGKDGRAVAPSVFGVLDGIRIGVFAFDDPQKAQIVGSDDSKNSFHVLTSALTAQGGDGMAAFVAPTEKTANTGPIHVAGSVQKGGGNDIAMQITLRAEGGPYDEAPRGPPQIELVKQVQQGTNQRNAKNGRKRRRRRNQGRRLGGR